MTGVGDRQAPLETDRIGCFADVALVRAAEHDLECLRRKASAVEDLSERHPGPFRGADRAKLPLFAIGGRGGLRAAAARALRGWPPRLLAAVLGVTQGAPGR